jgi:ABC-type uncharacterized transport system permease subunit
MGSAGMMATFSGWYLVRDYERQIVRQGENWTFICVDESGSFRPIPAVIVGALFGSTSWQRLMKAARAVPLHVLQC